MRLEVLAAAVVCVGATHAFAAGLSGRSAAVLLPWTGGLCIGASSDCIERLTAPEGFDLLVEFDLDSANLTPSSRKSLEAFARSLADERLATASFVIEGHSDARGGAAYNQTLSERRAEAVRSFLLECGVAPEKLGTAGFGETVPRVPDPTDPANRRVEMRIRIR
jgi:outer membrane protein OmpA-like peptidoglycan-associated protein